MEVGKYLILRWNTWNVEMRIPTKLRKNFIHGKDKPSHLQGKPMAKFSQSLKTDSLSLAEERKGPIVAHWLKLIRIAKNQTLDGDFVLDEEEPIAIEKYKLASAAGVDAERLIASDYNPEQVSEVKAKSKRTDLIGRVIGSGTSTKKYVGQWLEQCGYQQKGKDEAERFLNNNFCKRFRNFEGIERSQLKIWVDDMLEGRHGYRKHSRATVGKHIGFVTSYWEYCEGKYTNIECMTHRIMPKPQKTKKATQSILAKSWHPYSVSQYFDLLDAASTAKRGKGDHELKDLIIVGAHTGCRIGELCHMRLEAVTDKWVQVQDAKTYSGLREIPIHRDIQQLIERLKQTSTDGYLFSGLSDNNQYKDRSQGIGKRFGHLKTRVGFDERFSFHSLRSTLANRFENAGVPELFAARIIGHKATGGALTYGLYSGQIDWDNAVKSMNKIEYKRAA